MRMIGNGTATFTFWHTLILLRHLRLTLHGICPILHRIRLTLHRIVLSLHRIWLSLHRIRLSMHGVLLSLHRIRNWYTNVTAVNHLHLRLIRHNIRYGFAYWLSVGVHGWIPVLSLRVPVLFLVVYNWLALGN